MNKLLANKILNLQDGDHLCLFYDNDPAEQMPALLPFIREGLSKNEQFIYIADDQTVDELIGHLRHDEVDVDRETECGRLKLCTGEQWCRSGESSEERAEQVRGFVRDAMKSGFKGIRFAVEMTWTLGPAITADKLAHWEATVNTLFVPEFPGRVICQYNRAKLAPDVLLAALRTHPMAILGDDVCCNHFYEAPLILNGNDHTTSEGLGKRVDWMVSQLKRAHAAELEREITLRHQILTAEAERQSRILSLVPVGVYACDNEGRIIFYNKKAAELWGREPKLNDPREKFCGCCKVFQPDGTFVPPQQTPMAVALRERKSFRNTEAVVERPDGSRFSATVNIDVLAEDDGRVTGAINVFQDITDLKRSSEVLRQREQKLHAIVNGTPECVKVVAADGTLLEMNNAGLGLVEAESSAQVLGKCVYDIIATEHREAFRAMNERVCGGETSKLEFEIVGLKGTRRWMETRATPIIDPTSGRRVQLAITRDISERKRAGELSAQLAAIVEQSDDAIISKDLTGIIQSWNGGAEHLFGYSAHEVVGKSVTILIPPERADEEPEILKRIRSGERIAQYETVRRRKDGTLVDVSLTVSPIKDAAGKVIGVSKIARDISEKKRAKERLEQAIDERTASLRDAVAQLEEFSYTVSHDLRAPVRGMQAYSEAILNDFPDSLPKEAVDYLKRIATNAKRLDKMVLDVLTFSRLARADFKLERVNLDRLLHQIVEQYPGLQSPIAEIQIDPLPDVLGHEPSLTQAFSNLLNNSVKFVEPGVKPDVRVWAERNNGHIRLCVADNGIGVDPKFQHRLFSMFERIHPNLKKEGTGVGLAIVKKAVERMGGTVGMESDGKNGSRFWFELPAVNDLK